MAPGHLCTWMQQGSPGEKALSRLLEEGETDREVLNPRLKRAGRIPDLIKRGMTAHLSPQGVQKIAENLELKIFPDM